MRVDSAIDYGSSFSWRYQALERWPASRSMRITWSRLSRATAPRRKAEKYMAENTNRALSPDALAGRELLCTYAASNSHL